MHTRLIIDGSKSLQQIISDELITIRPFCHLENHRICTSEGRSKVEDQGGQFLTDSQLQLCSARAQSLLLSLLPLWIHVNSDQEDIARMDPDQH